MVRTVLIVLLAQLVLCRAALCEEEEGKYREVVIDDPYIEMHTGPGRGYPVFYVAERGEQIAVLKQRTDWFKVRDERGKEGWVHRQQLRTTLNLDGEPFDVPGLDIGDYADKKWEAGVLYGDFGGANAISTYGSFNFTPNLSGELWITEVLGRFSDSTMINANLVHTMFPDWRATPFFTLGTGEIHTSPKATLVATTDRTDAVAHVGFGARTYISRRFVFRAEYKTYVIFTNRDDNQEVREWKAGFSFFF